MHVLFTRVLEEENDAQAVENEINRVLTGVREDILSIQVEELQKDKEFKLYVLTR